MIRRLAPILAFALSPLTVLGQTASGTVPAGTPLGIVIDRNYPMRSGEIVRAHLLYPIYADNKLLLPKATVVTGTVVDLRSDHSRRVRAVLGGDFTPFHKPQVHFTQIVLPDGAAIPLSSGAAATGTQIYRAVAPPPAKGGFIRQEFNSGVSAARSDVATFTAPAREIVFCSSSTAVSPTTRSASRTEHHGRSKPPPVSTFPPSPFCPQLLQRFLTANRISGKNPRLQPRPQPATPEHGLCRPTSRTR